MSRAVLYLSLFSLPFCSLIPQICFPASSASLDDASSTNFPAFCLQIRSPASHPGFSSSIPYHPPPFLRSGLGFCPSLIVHPHSSCPRRTLSDHQLELFLDNDHTSRNVCPPVSYLPARHSAHAVASSFRACHSTHHPFLSFRFSSYRRVVFL